MTTKVLIETLTEVPDIDMLNEVFSLIKKTNALVMPDIRKFFDMMANLYMCKNQKIIQRTFDLNQHINKMMLNTQIEISWQFLGKSLVRLCGEENSQIRKRARAVVLEIMIKTNNCYMILEKLYYLGMEDQNIIVQVYSIKLIFRILEETPNILAKKSCISIVKLVLQKMVRLTNSQHSDLQKNADHFLHRLFFLKIDKMDEILHRMDSFYVKTLEAIWEKNKQNLLYKEEQDNISSSDKALKEIKYEHLPLINEKIFGVYEPFVIKNLFNPDSLAAKRYSVQQFKSLFLQNAERLTKYVNSICKMIVKLLPQKYIDVLELLDYIVSLPGITNIINLSELCSVLITQLDSENVPYRRQLRQILKKFNYMTVSSQIVIKKYQQALENDGQVIEQWLKIYQILCLIQHWAQNVEALQCYPPTLNFVVRYISENLNHKVIKVRDQCEKLLYFILQKFSGYRQNLEEYFPEDMVGHFEDVLESRKPYILPENKKSSASKQTFLKEYEQERMKFLKNQRNK